MMQIPRSTAFTVVFKMFLTGTSTPATGKTVAVTISKAGGAFANPAAGALNATEISNGWYKAALGTGDIGTLGILAVLGTATACDDYGDRFGVVKETNAGLTALPDTAVTTNTSLVTSGTGTDQISVVSGRVDLGKILGTASAGVAGYMALDWSHVNAPTTTVALTGTTIAPTQKVDVNTIKTQAVTCAAAVTVGAFLGNAHLLAVDVRGSVTMSQWDDGSIFGPVVLDQTTHQPSFDVNLTQVLGEPVQVDDNGQIVVSVSALYDVNNTHISQIPISTDDSGLLRVVSTNIPTPTTQGFSVEFAGAFVRTGTDATGDTLYCLVFDGNGAVSNGSGLEGYDNSRYASYVVTMPELQASQVYFGQFPTLAAGQYTAHVRKQLGGSPAETDTPIGSVTVNWDGAAGMMVPKVESNGTVHVSDPSTPANVLAVNADGSANADASIDPTSFLNLVIEPGFTMQDVLKVMSAVLGGKVSGSGTTNIAFRNLGDSKNRVAAVVDANGNRTNITLDLS